MFRFACLTLLLLLGSEIRLSHCTEVQVNNTEGKLCLYADLSVHFAVTYNSTDKMNHTVAFSLPEVENTTYNVRDIVFKYNLADNSTFKNASSNETKSVTFSPSISKVVMDTYYSCKSADTLDKDFVVQTLSNVSLQAFISNGNKSDKDTVCARDRSTTTAMPTTHTTTVTTLPTTPTPLPTPPTVNYTVPTGVNGSVCLKASMGLQLSYKDGADFHKMNIGKDQFKTSGKCGVNGSDATLVLSSSTVNMTFTFHEEGKKFLLHALNVTIKGTNGTINQGNTNLSLWEASVGSSYMCNKEQSYNISNGLTLNTFSLQVQPFGVKDDKFATAQECSMDDTNILIPIIVGAALAGLIVIVLIAYAIGRRKTYVGYQSL
ncbi:hypothetical protein AGOR_G00068900 [Albula goreensis]|uniref:Lysosome-associated membrane glycoprotein 2 n=1 Tax=Albula goreensis TaxID=1534307 RepID=A0A8T3DQI5_9TELE|nr:hypothetical protein AGOR_G00068900 [Albula goreensis]